MQILYKELVKKCPISALIYIVENNLTFFLFSYNLASTPPKNIVKNLVILMLPR